MTKLDNCYPIKIALYSVFFIVIDQAVKLNIKQFFPDLICENQGIIFGWIENEYLKYFFLLLGFILLVWLVSKSQLSVISYQLSVSLILAGALSNVLDRIFYGFVIDYIQLPLFLSWWPKFNLADIFIVAGVIIYLMQILKPRRLKSFG